MSEKISKNELSEDNILNIIIDTNNIVYFSSNTYIWVIAKTDSYIDKLDIYPIMQDDEISEMMITRGNSYYKRIDRFIDTIKNNENIEIVGFAEERKKAIQLTEEHYKNNYMNK